MAAENTAEPFKERFTRDGLTITEERVVGIVVASVTLDLTTF
jgi:hypothetical protein